ncbi:hypothetical protein MKY84_07585 [Chryseomicrobium sp. FSL W7-1435]|uniref:metalloprotease n=1 Tax=Chryseomicrobium sp. FSL W7-1435 TaxID=2921704 RepID=UPI003159CB4B
MKLRIHPVLVIWFGLLVITGQAGLFSLVFASLLIHELGHLMALKLCGVKSIHCTLLPFGGRLEWQDRREWKKRDMLFVYSGGPLATSALFSLLLLMPFPIPHLVLQIQLIILALNLLPIPPLDGGNMLRILLKDSSVAILLKPIYLITFCCFGLYAYNQIAFANLFPAMIWGVLALENYRTIKS